MVENFLSLLNNCSLLLSVVIVVEIKNESLYSQETDPSVILYIQHDSQPAYTKWLCVCNKDKLTYTISYYMYLHNTKTGAVNAAFAQFKI